MSELNDVTHVINKTAHIENLLDQIIVNFTCPRNDAFFFFWQVVMDSSIMSLGAKIKTVMAISQECNYKLDQNSLHSVISYRNAFSHNETNSNPTWVVSSTPEENSSHYSLHILKNSGKIQRVKRIEALDQFNTAYAKAKSSLMPLREQTISIAKEAGAEHVGP